MEPRDFRRRLRASTAPSRSRSSSPRVEPGVRGRPALRCPEHDAACQLDQPGLSVPANLARGSLPLRRPRCLAGHVGADGRAVGRGHAARRSGDAGSDDRLDLPLSMGVSEHGRERRCVHRRRHVQRLAEPGAHLSRPHRWRDVRGEWARGPRHHSAGAHTERPPAPIRWPGPDLQHRFDDLPHDPGPDDARRFDPPSPRGTVRLGAPRGIVHLPSPDHERPVLLRGRLHGGLLAARPCHEHAHEHLLPDDRCGESCISHQLGGTVPPASSPT